MFIINYLRSFLDYFKIFQKKCTLVLLGLDNAGKTTFLYRLKEDRMSIYDPTLYAYSEEIQLGNILFKIVDVGGHKSMRKIWRNFYMNTNAIIYIVDAADIGRLQESMNIRDPRQKHAGMTLQGVYTNDLGERDLNIIQTLSGLCFSVSS